MDEPKKKLNSGDNPLLCETCNKYVSSGDFFGGGHSDMLRGEIYTDEKGNITKWTCAKCVMENELEKI
jgi:hypothetical protein